MINYEKSTFNSMKTEFLITEFNQCFFLICPNIDIQSPYSGI